METAIIDTSQTWTQKEYLALEEGQNHQLLNGKLIMSPAPLIVHQRTLRKLTLIFDQYAAQHEDEMFFAPTDVFLDDYNVPQPDLVYLLKKNQGIISARGINGAPDLVVEVISPSNSFVDRYEKKSLYQKFKVPEYWIVDPGNKTLEVYGLKNNEYELYQYLSEAGKINSPLLPSLEIHLEDIF